MIDLYGVKTMFSIRHLLTARKSNLQISYRVRNELKSGDYEILDLN